MYDNLISDMDLHYFDKFKTPGKQFMLIVAHSQYLMLGVTDIEVGKVYAAQVSSDWHRVKVFIYSGQKPLCSIQWTCCRWFPPKKTSVAAIL